MGKCLIETNMIPKMKKKTLMISAGTWEMSESKDCRNIIYVYVHMYFLGKGLVYKWIEVCRQIWTPRIS